LYFNAFLPVRISVYRRTRLGVATLQSVFSWAEFCFKNWAIVLRLTSNSISASQHIGVIMFLLFYTSCSSINKLMTMSGNFCPPVRQWYFSMLGVAFQKTYSAKISWRSMPTILVKIHEFLCCCLMVLALTLPLSLLLFVL
jgi:hypothetical protein